MNRRDFIKNSTVAAVALQTPGLRGAALRKPGLRSISPVSAMDAAERRLGVTFGFNSPRGYFSSCAARSEVERMVEFGVRWCTVTPAVLPDGDEDDLRFVLDWLHASGIRTCLRPTINSPDGHGRIAVWFPPDRERIPGLISRHRADWFARFAERSCRYARLARLSGCAAYGFGGEHDRMVKENDHWKNVLAAARSEFAGLIESCHSPVVDLFAELQHGPDHWLHELDELSVRFFHPAADRAGATADEMAAKLAREWVPYYREVAQAFGKPLRFGECGCPSFTGGAIAPAADAPRSTGYAPAEQQNYLEAVCRAFSPEPWWHGLDWWTWEVTGSNRVPAAPDDQGFALSGKPAADTFQAWTQQLS